MVLLFFGVAGAAFTIFVPVQVVSYSVFHDTSIEVATEIPTEILNESSINTDFADFEDATELVDISAATDLYHAVPFYSQFADITPVEWRKIGCGIAATAMLIDFYSTEAVNVDELLNKGIEKRAYLDDAGWTHQGLINLTKEFGLDGLSQSLHHLTMSDAFEEFQSVVAEGPVMVSVHYTFQPTNPIPHLAVITGIDDERVYYNDPADQVGGNSITIEQFQSAWKKRYIAIRPAV